MKTPSAKAGDVVKREHPLQAVVLADSFTQTFRPITLERPKVLMPLANVPMLEYTIELLASSGVEEILVFCSNHAEMIESFLKTSNCTRRVKVECISSLQCSSVGDAMRELDVKHVLRSDPFILISGDVLSNVNLHNIVQEHKERKRKDSSSIMTVLFKQSGLMTNPNGMTRSLQSDLVVAMDLNNENQIVLYDDSMDKAKVELPTVFFKQHSSVQFRYDLVDCHIDVCSLDILVQFSDNFDYLDIRKDFVANEVQNFELGHRIHAKVIASTSYAAKVHDPRTYHAVSMDVLNRWVYPIVPDNNFLDSTAFTYRRHGIYKENDVIVARSTEIGQNTLIGAQTCFEKGCRVECSTIGRGCQIGERVHIRSSHLWNNVTVESDVVIHDAILCDNVVVRKGAVIERGCILSFGVVIGENCTVKEFTKVTTHGKVSDGFSSDDGTDDEDNTDKRWHAEIVGAGGEGRIWTLEEDDGFSDDETKLRCTLMGCRELAEDRAKLWDEYDDSSSDDGSFTEFEVESSEARFTRVVSEMILSGEKAGHDLDNIFLEIKSFKFAQNRSFVDCLSAIIPTLLLDDSGSNNNAMQLLAIIKTRLEKWTPILKKCIMGSTEERCILHTVENFVHEHETPYLSICRYLLQILYDQDLVSEESILNWFNECSHAQIVEESQVMEFIQWLQEEDDDDSDSNADSD